MRVRPGIWLVTLLSAVVISEGLLYFFFFADLAIPEAPWIGRTLTPKTKGTPQEIGDYDVLGRTVSKAEADELAPTSDGRRYLAPENGAVKITQDLLDLGRRAFYEETYGNEVFLTDVVGVIDGPINISKLTKAVTALGGKPTTNLQVRLDRDVTIGGRTFRRGTWVNTGLDVPPGALVPLGMRVFLQQGRLRVGMTCAACHAAVDPDTGAIIEGAPNADVNAGLLLAFATNSAAFFRQTGINPTRFPAGDHIYLKADGREARLPDPIAVEDAVDAALLAWPPGNFDSTGDLQNNPTQIPTSYTFGAWPYGWSGFASTGWFHGLTTLNANVHGTNSDMTTGADSSEDLLGIDKETYLGIILQRSANEDFRLSEGERPSLFFKRVDPTPGTPGMNQAVSMPGYPKGSIFILDGLMPNTPGLPVAAQLNGMSAWQNTLSPPPSQSDDSVAIRRGAQIFSKAGCGNCHAGRYFTSNRVIAQPDIGTHPSRAKALAAFWWTFVPPETYPANVPVPLPPGPNVLPVPTDITAAEDRRLAYARDNPAGGYKVPSLLGLRVSAPYLHDGGVAAGPEAFRREGERRVVAKQNQLGTSILFRGMLPDPGNSLRAFLDRDLRASVIAANRADPRLQKANVDGSGHHVWVDRAGGYSLQDQDDLIAFLLSLDDEPIIVP
ncbi:uncharacterized protein sS8_0746 [Methylocaldum marinum]|uniref:Cytochrome c domain-containing protein n=1 Tax=Methylocaldum marinum TaxID=1432792 RepID=A0A250KP20_9GAMM|nr:hypothetical protein [Methylocaldum marinum]BBA32711.1 uncharacterized protein sS8_0746 [Methylocaldum marinum]